MGSGDGDTDPDGAGDCEAESSGEPDGDWLALVSSEEATRGGEGRSAHTAVISARIAIVAIAVIQTVRDRGLDDPEGSAAGCPGVDGDASAEGEGSTREGAGSAGGRAGGGSSVDMASSVAERECPTHSRLDPARPRGTAVRQDLAS